MISNLIILMVAALCSTIVPQHNKRLQKIVLLIFAGILIVFAGFRKKYSTPDYAIYVDMFLYPSFLKVEPAFSTISALVHYFAGNQYVYLFVIFALLAVILKSYAIIRLTDLWLFSLLVYISYFFILHDLIQIRAGVSSALLLLALKPLTDRKLLPFLGLSILAITFHYTALLMLPLWFLPKLNKKILALLIPFAYILYFLKLNIIYIIPIPYIKEKIEIYQQLQSVSSEMDKINVFNMLFLLKVSIFYFFLLKYKTVEAKNRYFPILLRVYGLALFSFVAFSTMPVVAFRVYEYLATVEIILIPLLWYCFRYKLIGRISIYSISLLLFYFILFYNKLIPS